MSTLRELFSRGISLLRKLPHASLEAQLLILISTGLSKERFFSSLERTVTKSEERRFERLAARRLAGCPLAYLTGTKEFWSIDFRVSPGVLIPRPETELIIDRALALSQRRKVTIVDIGTGCGNIALALARELPWARVFATDISLNALEVAQSNAKSLGLKRVVFLRGDLFSPLKKLHLENGFDFVLSNPPYVSEEDWRRLPSEIRRHEPQRALLAGPSGLEIISKIIPKSLEYLKPGGYLLLEIGKGQLRRALSYFGPRWSEIDYVTDFRSIPRLLVARK